MSPSPWRPSPWRSRPGRGSGSVAADHLLRYAAGIVPDRIALAFCAEQALNGGAGLPFGDGLRCDGVNLQRLGIRLTAAAGGASWGPGLALQAGLVPGDTTRFQLLYRDPIGSPCGRASI